MNEDWEAVRRDWERSVYEQADRDDDRAAMNIDPHPPGFTPRPFTEAELATMETVRLADIGHEGARDAIYDQHLAGDHSLCKGECFEPDPACGACGLITVDELFHDCGLAPAGMPTIRARLELVPYVIVDSVGFYWGSTTSRSLALDTAAKIRGRVVTARIPGAEPTEVIP